MTELGITAAERNIVWPYNPFRYRGYYYDTETGFYYLQSRYYNPQWGRFLNADGYVNANGDMIGFNMYAYCSNNPVMAVDKTGSVARAVSPNAVSMGGFGYPGLKFLSSYGTAGARSSPLVALTTLLSAQAGFLGAAISALLCDSVAMEEALTESQNEQAEPSAIYMGFYIKDHKSITSMTKAMTFDEASTWALGMSKTTMLRRDDCWGLYTPNASDAADMAKYLAVQTGGIPLLEEPTKKQTGHYYHYHTDRNKFGRYKHFHVWYGLPVT